MAPEQARQAAVTAAADLYALGCVLYEMLVGAPPFDGGTAFEVLTQHIEQAPTPVATLRGEVPAELDAIVARLLEKDPADRPANAAEVVGLLLPFATAPGPGVAGVRGNPAVRRSRSWRRATRAARTASPARRASGGIGRAR